MFYLCYLCLFIHIVLCFCFVCRRLVYPMLPVSLDCFCFVYLRLVYPMLPVSPDCPFLIASSVFSNVYIQDDLYIYYILLIMNLNHVEPQGSIYLYKYNDVHYDVWFVINIYFDIVNVCIILWQLFLIVFNTSYCT
jgi:hypothetical protein